MKSEMQWPAKTKKPRKPSNWEAQTPRNQELKKEQQQDAAGSLHYCSGMS